METWKAIDGFPDYEVSDLGRVRLVVDKNNRPSGHIMRPSNGRYRLLGLTDNGRRKGFGVHRLVCAAFHGPQPSPEHEVAHLDNDPWNNIASNLAWVTKKENQSHRVANNTHSRGEAHWAARLTEADVRYIRDRSNGTGAAMSRAFGVTDAAISAIRRGKLWRHLT